MPAANTGNGHCWVMQALQGFTSMPQIQQFLQANMPGSLRVPYPAISSKGCRPSRGQGLLWELERTTLHHAGRTFMHGCQAYHRHQLTSTPRSGGRPLQGRLQEVST